MDKGWITFDLDETIMKNPFKKWVFPEIVSIFEHELKEEHNIMELVVEEHLRRMSENKFLEAYDWDHIINELLFLLDVNAEIDVTALVEKHAISPKIYLLEDTMLDSLRMIKNRGYKIAAATNGYHKYQYPVLRHLQLDTLFDEVIASDTAGFAKPNPLILQSIEHKGKVVAHVGDRIDHDVVMANELHIISIFINKNLSQEILELPINKRNRHPGFLVFCEEKWYKENRLRNSPFCEEVGLPDIVVGSIEELAMNIDGIKP